jgi:ATP-binding cassette, subfamily C (CFTR/MRP), member 1
VITIAHRLHTVASYDVILVMDGGRAVEFGSPRALLEREGSLFRQLLSSVHGDALTAFLRALSSDKANAAV